mmetsp:Transcript_38502/g.61765  ORF Transcript_38502/g.61765 Transcript_38502/m.61765 type:complete len:197 (+) Transcript_38502:34-624(+)
MSLISDPVTALLRDTRQEFQTQGKDEEIIYRALESIQDSEVVMRHTEVNVKQLIEDLTSSVQLLEHKNGQDWEEKKAELEERESTVSSDIAAMKTKMDGLTLNRQGEEQYLQKLTEKKEKMFAENESKLAESQKNLKKNTAKLNVYKVITHIEWKGLKDGTAHLMRKKEVRPFELKGDSEFDQVNDLWNVMWEDHC